MAKLKETAVDNNGEAVVKIKAYEASNPFPSPLPPLPGHKYTPNGAEGRQQAAGVASRASDGVAGAPERSEARAGDGWGESSSGTERVLTVSGATDRIPFKCSYKIGGEVRSLKGHQSPNQIEAYICEAAGFFFWCIRHNIVEMISQEKKQ